MIRLVFLTMFAIQLATPALPFGRECSQGGDPLQGTWLVTAITRRGKAEDADRIEGLKMVIAGNNMTLTGGKQTERSFSFKLDQAKKPKSIDLTALDGRFKGTLIAAIYQLEGDSLKLCMPNDSVKAQRPTEFAAPEGSPMILFILKKS